MRRRLFLPVAAVLALALACGGCGGGAGFDPTLPVTVVSREEGSGTRSAFVELFGLMQPGADGQMWDMTTQEAVIINNTAVMMGTVASNRYAVGYISFGSMNDSVKALRIDGALPTAENILNGSYAIARPFVLATRAGAGPAAQDFIAFILSAEGQDIVLASGYIPLQGAAPYAGAGPGGKVVVAGSSSVAPVMEKLKEAYIALNPGVTIEVQQNDSSTGISAAAQGICDIGMASRQLKESEQEAGLVPIVMAMDGIAVVVNRQNPVSALSSRQVAELFSGREDTWQAFVQG